MSDVLRILGLWRTRVMWLAIGLVVSLAALASGVGMMAMGGALLAGGVIAASIALRGLGSARVVLRYAERLTTHEATFRALADLRVWFFRNLARSGSGGLGFRQAGDALARLVTDIEALDGIYLRILVPLAGAILLLPVLVVLIGLHSAGLALVIGTLFAVAAFVLPWLGANMAMRAAAALAETIAALRITALDTLTGLREVRAFGAEGRMLAAVQAREASLLTAQHDLASRTAFANAGAFLCAQAAILAILVAAGSNPTAAVVAAFLVVAAFEAVGGLPRAGVLAGHAAAAARRVLEAAEVPVAVPDPPQPAAIPAGITLRFEGVHFQWRADRPPVFDGLSLEVPQGARVALLGPSGAGKSTLAALALKVVAPQQGKITLGGIDIATLAATDVRARFGWLAQATHLFDDTIRANLKLARPGADDTALWAALDAAHIGEMVRALPDRLDTWVGEGGARFSGGQGRRLALARALLSPAPILILDEPCAGLDAETERAFLATLNDVASDRSVILITHRLTGVERLDRIWRLSGGKAIAAAA
ncbi:MAG TPA: thiol reductant ABC exporter subunit CydC [Acetobacteraceae bacterium]|nr:thiol reductant ABC exporter subunit CydC [Acetobacteraceae bacterium]